MKNNLSFLSSYFWNDQNLSMKKMKPKPLEEILIQK